MWAASEGRVGQSFGPAVDHQIERGVYAVDADRHDHGVGTFGFRPQDLKLAELAVVALLAPVVHEIAKAVGRAGLPEAIGFSKIPFLKRGQETRYCSLLRIVSQPIAQKGAGNHDQGDHAWQI